MKSCTSCCVPTLASVNPRFKVQSVVSETVHVFPFPQETPLSQLIDAELNVMLKRNETSDSTIMQIIP